MQNQFMRFTVVAENTVSHRDIRVINGIPFYSSTGASEDNEEIVAPAWREGLFMPISGLKTGDKAGQFNKLGALFPNNHSFMEKIKETLWAVYNSMDQENADVCLRSLLLEKYQANADIDTNMIVDAITGQLTRFGTIEATLISMKISPEIWTRNILLKNFMERMESDYPEFSFYDSYNLPAYINGAQLRKSFELQRTDKSARHAASLEINQWLLTEINVSIKHPRNVPMIPGISFIAAGIAAGTTGSLILGNVLNIGLLSGVGVLGGLSTAAACTGFGLVAVAALLIGLGCYLLYKSYTKPQVLAEQNAIRSNIKDFLMQNSFSVANSSSFFSGSESLGSSRIPPYDIDDSGMASVSPIDEPSETP